MKTPPASASLSYPRALLPCSSAKTPPSSYSFPPPPRQSRPLLRRASPLSARRCQITASSSRLTRDRWSSRAWLRRILAAESVPISRDGGQEPSIAAEILRVPLPPLHRARDTLVFRRVSPGYPPSPRATSLPPPCDS